MADNEQRTLAESIAEGLLGSMDIVVQKALSDLQFDKTYQPCKIIQRAEDEANKYVCEYENKRFEAYSDQSFFADDLVQVLVPQNNWNNQKTIVGRVMMAGAAAFNFKYPFDDFITVGQMDVEDLYSLLAGCTPIIVSELLALPADSRQFISNQEHYTSDNTYTIGNTQYIFGHTPYSIQGIMDDLATADQALVASYAKSLIIFANKTAIINLIKGTEKDSTYAQNWIATNVTNDVYWTADFAKEIFRKISIALNADKTYPVGVEGELQKANDSLATSQAISLVNTRCAELAAQWDTSLDTSKNYSFVVTSVNNDGETVYSTTTRKSRLVLLNTLEATRQQRQAHWLDLLSHVVDWTKISRDLTYDEFVQIGVIDKAHWAQHVETWINKNVDNFRSRTMSEVYNQYRMTAICGGPDNIFKFWANRHFKDRLHENHYNLPRMKLCSFVPTNGAKAIQGFTRAGLSLDITTLLGGQRIIKGEYGVYIQIEGSRATSADEETAEVITKEEYEVQLAKLEAAYLEEKNAILADDTLDVAEKQIKIDELDERYDPQFRQLERMIVLNDAEDSSTGATSDVRFDDVFSSTSDFYGNVYAYQVPYTQQKLLNIDNFISITRISLYVYQSFDKLEQQSEEKRQITLDLAAERENYAKLDAQYSYYRYLDDKPSDWSTIVSNRTTSAQRIAQLEERYNKLITEPEYGWMKEGQDPRVYYKRAKDGYTYEQGYTIMDPDDVNPEFEDELPENIYIEKPYLGLGFSVQELKDGKLILYTMGDLNYGALGTTANPESDTRDLKLVWVYPDENGVLNIYPTWKPGYDIHGVWQDKVELQPSEYDLFYRREQSATLEALKELYTQRYSQPYDSARAKKQKQIYEALSEWITIIRNSLDNAKSYWLQEKAAGNVTQSEWERRKNEFIERDRALQRQLTDLSSIADMSVLGDGIAKAERSVDYYRGKMTDAVMPTLERIYADTSLSEDEKVALVSKIDTLLSDLENRDKSGLLTSTANKEYTNHYATVINNLATTKLPANELRAIYNAAYNEKVADYQYELALAKGVKGSTVTNADIQTIAERILPEAKSGAQQTSAKNINDRQAAIDDYLINSFTFETRT